LLTRRLIGKWIEKNLIYTDKIMIYYHKLKQE
jgi:hypothetical protein